MYSTQQYSSKFVFAQNLTFVSHISKSRKSVVLLSTLHNDLSFSELESCYKPEIISFYNATKSDRLDALDKIINEYSHRRCTRWPLSFFMNFTDLATYNTFVLWLIKYPSWKSPISIKIIRRIFLEILGSELYGDNIEWHITALENRQIAFHKHVINSIEATIRGTTLTWKCCSKLFQEAM